ncbi:MAG: hypothetical protein B5M53_03735 [Candidatus Cloacimonas sp. 4484_209]|nr:MAG: hypothetical protein B5M53_03735 [Candidatus Cloacimonas sp. 4484_209]
MPQTGKRRKRKAREIKQEIINFIESLDFPATTEQIAKGVGVNWYAAKLYLGELMREGKVFHKRIGRQNQWWTEKVDEQRKKIRELEKVVKEKDEMIEKLEDKTEKQDEIIKNQDRRIRELKSKLDELVQKGIK